MTVTEVLTLLILITEIVALVVTIYNNKNKQPPHCQWATIHFRFNPEVNRLSLRLVQYPLYILIITHKSSFVKNENLTFWNNYVKISLWVLYNVLAAWRFKSYSRNGGDCMTVTEVLTLLILITEIVALVVTIYNNKNK